MLLFYCQNRQTFITMYALAALFVIFALADSQYVVPFTSRTPGVQDTENSLTHVDRLFLLNAYPNVLEATRSATRPIAAEYIDTFPPFANGPVERSTADHNARVVNARVAAEYAGQVARGAAARGPIDSYGRLVRADNLDYNSVQIFDDGSYKDAGREKLFDDGSYKQERNYW